MTSEGGMLGVGVEPLYRAQRCPHRGSAAGWMWGPRPDPGWKANLGVSWAEAGMVPMAFRKPILPWNQLWTSGKSQRSLHP